MDDKGGGEYRQEGGEVSTEQDVEVVGVCTELLLLLLLLLNYCAGGRAER